MITNKNCANCHCSFETDDIMDISFCCSDCENCFYDALAEQEEDLKELQDYVNSEFDDINDFPDDEWNSEIEDSEESFG